MMSSKTRFILYTILAYAVYYFCLKPLTILFISTVFESALRNAGLGAIMYIYIALILVYGIFAVIYLVATHFIFKQKTFTQAAAVIVVVSPVLFVLLSQIILIPVSSRY